MMTMIHIYLSGRLGNLVLQHSLAFYFKQENVSVVFLSNGKEDYNNKLIINPSKTIIMNNDYLENQINNYGLFEYISIRLFRYRSIKSKSPISLYYQGLFSTFKKSYLNKRNGILLGVWLNPLYHIKYKAKFSEILINEISMSVNKPLYRSNLNNDDIVGVHIRRGDYLNLKSDGYIVLGKDYYENAMKLMFSKLNQCRFQVFSDDIPWCKLNLNISNFEIEFIENQSPLEDYFCMLKKSNLIISNSSFSWTAAFFNNNIKNVIAPKHWFNDKRVSYKDICPSEWTILD